MKSYISELDSKRFGFNVAKIDLFEDSPRNILGELIKLNVKLIISRINSTEINLINEIEDLGFRLKDTQIILEHDLININNYSEGLEKIEDINIREGNSYDAKNIALIAGNSFQNYGHYNNDILLPTNKVKDIYFDWAYRSSTDKNYADKVIVAEINNNIVGFLTIKWSLINGKSIANLRIGAISENMRNKGIFRLITNKCLNVAKENNSYKVITHVLTDNIPVNRSLNKIGFKHTGALHTFHCWI